MEQNIFWQKFFHKNYVEVVQQLLPSRKVSFIALKYHFLAQQSISTKDNKTRQQKQGQIFYDKNFSVEILLKLFKNQNQKRNEF